jgi:hypothetical protein
MDVDGQGFGDIISSNRCWPAAPGVSTGTPCGYGVPSSRRRQRELDFAAGLDPIEAFILFSSVDRR